MLNRRRWLTTSARGFTGMIVWRCSALALQAAPPGGADATQAESEKAASKKATSKKATSKKIVSIVEFSDAGARERVTKVPMIVKSDDEWRQQLAPLAFAVTRRGETERPFSGPYWNIRDKGLYRCICCATAVFGADKKFESETGWPSFWTPLAKENIREHADYRFGMSRIAVSCRRCDAHLGHVFDDGPEPTGLRYCINSASLQFIKA